MFQANRLRFSKGKILSKVGIKKLHKQGCMPFKLIESMVENLLKETWRILRFCLNMKLDVPHKASSVLSKWKRITSAHKCRNMGEKHTTLQDIRQATGLTCLAQGPTSASDMEWKWHHRVPLGTEEPSPSKEQAEEHFPTSEIKN